MYNQVVPRKRTNSFNAGGVIAKRLIGYAARSAANYVVPRSGDLAAGGFRLASRAFQRRRSTAGKRVVLRKKAADNYKRSKYYTKGTFAGKLRKGGSNKKPESVYANKGVVRTSEVIGVVADPDCVYITHTAVDGYKLVEVAVQALVRKLFEKLGYRITNVDEVLGHISISDAKDWQIELTQIAGKTGVESVLGTHVTVAGSTVRTVAAAFLTNFMQFSSGFTTTPGVGSASNDNRLHRFILYGQDFNVTRQPVFECELRLADETMCVYGKSELKIQNRTLSATGSTDTNDISNNPLLGRSYMFSEIPKMRDKTAFALNSLPIANGVQLVRSTTIGNTTFKEPPLPQLFSNCKKSSVIRLEPGHIKHSFCMFKKSMKFMTFLEKIKLQYGSGTEFLNYQSMFPCEMFAFEDLINVNVSQNISCAYESNQTVGVYFKTARAHAGVSTFDSQTYNNVPT